MVSHVYILTCRPCGTLYLGVTSNIGQHLSAQDQRSSWVTARYGVDRLVWMEDYDRIGDAIAREKMLKKWRRAWKIALIEEANPTWEDLFSRPNC